MKSNPKTTSKLTNELTNSKVPHVFKVSLIEIPKDCWNNRKLPSYIKAIVLLPTAQARTISTGFTLKTAIIAATAPLPCKKPNEYRDDPSKYQWGHWKLSDKSNYCITPPAAITKSTFEMPSIALVNWWVICVPVWCIRYPNTHIATKTAISILISALLINSASL